MKNKKNNPRRTTGKPVKASNIPVAVDAKKKAGKPIMRFFKPFMFFLLVIFCTIIYGNVFARAEQEMYVCTDSSLLKFVLDQPMGWLVVAGRWAMLVFKSKWIGGILLAAILTATACQIDYILRLPKQWRGISFLLPIAELGWMANKGITIYYRSEPALIILVPLCTFIILLCISLVMRFIRRKQKAAEDDEKAVSMTKEYASLTKSYGALVSLAAFVALAGYAIYFQQNTRLAASMQLKLWEQDWEGMTEDALSARKPSRTVAAYYAISLLRQNILIEHIFDIPYNYPNDEAKTGNVNDESGMYVTDCNFEAGLAQPAYHESMEAHVMYGISLYRLKRMTLCALLTEEYVLAKKYLALISKMPFESAFVEKYGAMADNPRLIDQDPELADIKDYFPKESHFEQYYMTPSFLGYNVGLMEGSNKTLTTSIAACLYSKKIETLVPRLEILKNQGIALHPILQQAILCGSVKHPELTKMFQVSQMVSSEMQAFLRSAVPYKDDKDKMRDELKEQWLGSYMYYYFCENNDSIATGKANTKSSGVN